MKRQLTYPILLVMVILSMVSSACAPLAQQAPSGGNRAEMPAAEAAAPAGEMESAPAAGAAEAAAPAAPTYRADRPATNQQYEPVTAGVTDDNAQWADYLDYLNRNWFNNAIAVDVSEQYRIQVVDELNVPVHNATVEVYIGDALLFSGRTDTAGRLLFHPLAQSTTQGRWWQLTQRSEVRVVASKGYVAQSATFYRGQGESWQLTLTDPERAPYAQLDLLFLVDATGSMDDEIDKLKESMAAIADQIGALPARPDVRYGLVAYRDQGDAFVVRTNDFTADLWDFQRSLAALRADGGGDEPEALNEALHRSLYDLHWRSDDTVRLIILVGDAPPHLDYYSENFNYATDMVEAVRQGIKIFPVGASSLSPDGEYVFRQLAQFTGGKFVFLTYADGNDPSSGPGTETNHDVENYSVDTLDRLVVRLVSEELAPLQGPVTLGNRQPQQQPSPVPTPTPVPVRQPLSCTLDFSGGRSDCERGIPFDLVEQNETSAFLRLKFDPADSEGYTRARFAITFAQRLPDNPANPLLSFNDYAGNRNGEAGAELFIRGRSLYLLGASTMPAQHALDGQRLLRQIDNLAVEGDTLILEVANDRVGINSAAGIEVVESPDLFTLDWPSNNELFVVFNRSLDGSLPGFGVSKVEITLYPAR